MIPGCVLLADVEGTHVPTVTIGNAVGLLHGRKPCTTYGSGRNMSVEFERDCRKPSQLPKKNSLSFLIGPPRSTPNWFRRNGGGPESGSTISRASRALFRKNSYAPPWRSFVPAREVALITAPLPANS